MTERMNQPRGGRGDTQSTLNILLTNLQDIQAQMNRMQLDIVTIRTTQALEANQFKNLEELVRQNKILMYGDEDSPGTGLLIRVDRMERIITALTWVVGVALTVIIGLTVSGFWQILLANSK